jgi:hypothetical protein
VRAAVAGFHDAGAAASDHVDGRLQRARGVRSRCRRSAVLRRSSRLIANALSARPHGCQARPVRVRSVGGAGHLRGEMRALPKMTIVDSMPCSCCTISGFSSSSCMRTGRSSSRSRKRVSVKASR